ncbi:MAG: hypothetical protein Q8L43_00520, partial [Deltaproteobacteria bacterium]|nr:hypothetical protein [Deltaproteobacteria bacterium]
MFLTTSSRKRLGGYFSPLPSAPVRSAPRVSQLPWWAGINLHPTSPEPLPPCFKPAPPRLSQDAISLERPSQWSLLA